MFEQEILNFLERRHYSRIIPKAALIDMDGTLYDSMPNHAAAWHRMVSELGIPSQPREYYLWEGRTGASVINILFNRAYGHDATPEEIKSYYRRKTEYFLELPKPSPMPGAAEMLKFLATAGIKRVLVTGSGQDSLIGKLAADFPDSFTPELMVTAHDVQNGKPDPEPFLRGLQKAAIPASAAIGIDNAPLGCESSSRAGVFTVGVVTGPLKREELTEAGADVVFSSMNECAQLLPLLVYSMKTIQREH